MARNKSILTEAKQIERAVTLINLGARLQVLESETDLSYERLLRLYKEVAGKSPSKGQLPFSTDWFMTWQPNIHASLFLNMHEYLNKAAALDEIDTVIKAYQLYLEQMQSQGLEPLLSVTRAWRLVKFVDNGMLSMTACSKCGGHFVTPSARDCTPLRLWPVQPACSSREGQAGRLTSTRASRPFGGRRALSKRRPRTLLTSACSRTRGQGRQTRCVDCFMHVSSWHSYLCFQRVLRDPLFCGHAVACPSVRQHGVRYELRRRDFPAAQQLSNP